MGGHLLTNCYEKIYFTSKWYEIFSYTRYECACRLYLIKWKGYDTDESTWEPKENLNDEHVIEKIRVYKIDQRFVRKCYVLIADCSFIMAILLLHWYSKAKVIHAENTFTVKIFIF